MKLALFSVIRRPSQTFSIWISACGRGGAVPSKGSGERPAKTRHVQRRRRRKQQQHRKHESIQHFVPDGQRHGGRMGPAVLLHLLHGVRRRDGRVGRRGDRADGDIRRVRRGQLVHRVGRAPVSRNAHRHQLFPAQPHRGRPAVRRHHARPGLRPRQARLAVRRLRVPRTALLAGNARRPIILF